MASVLEGVHTSLAPVQSSDENQVKKELFYEFPDPIICLFDLKHFKRLIDGDDDDAESVAPASPIDDDHEKSQLSARSGTIIGEVLEAAFDTVYP